jgi:RNA-dependent RNA polymerase
MDVVHRQAKKEGDLKRAQVEKLFPNVSHAELDPDLTAPWKSAQDTGARAQAEHKFRKLNDDLELIRDHVHSVYDGHKARMKQAVDENGKIKMRNKEKGAGFTDLPIEVRQDVLRASAKEFASKPLQKDVLYSKIEIARLRASYAYIYDQKQEKKGWSR